MEFCMSWKLLNIGGYVSRVKVVVEVNGDAGLHLRNPRRCSWVVPGGAGTRTRPRAGPHTRCWTGRGPGWSARSRLWEALRRKQALPVSLKSILTLKTCACIYFNLFNLFTERQNGGVTQSCVHHSFIWIKRIITNSKCTDRLLLNFIKYWPQSCLKPWLKWDASFVVNVKSRTGLNKQSTLNSNGFLFMLP